MKIKATGQSKPQKSIEFYKKLCQLTFVGGIIFWITTIITSLLPLAAEYRAAYSNWSIQTVWINSLLAGMIIGCCVSYFLLRFYERIPAKDSIQKSLIVSTITLIIAIIMIDVPMIISEPRAAFNYFLIGVLFNSVRFLFLGVGIGYLYKRL